MAIGQGLSRGRHHAISPFFAFQDIITSAISVLIAIVLLLAVSLGDSGSIDGDSGSHLLRDKLAALLADLQGAETELRAVRDKSDAELRDPKLLRAEVETLRGELSSLNSQADHQHQQLENLHATDATGAVRAELAKKEAVIAARLAQVDADAGSGQS